MQKKIESYIFEAGGDVFIDVGANVGMWAKELYGDYNKIYFIEPSSKAMDLAVEQIFDPENKIVFLQNLCSSESGVTKNIYSPSDDTGNFSIYAKDLYEEKLGIKQSENDIDTIMVDDLLDQITEGSRILLKVDTEGHDLDVLLGAKELIKKFRPTVCIELHFHMHYDEQKYKEVFDLFESLNYSRQDFKSNWYNGPALVDGKHTGDQMYDLHYQVLMTPN